MKKVMLFIVSMLFAVNVNAASIDVTEVGSSFASLANSSIANNGESVHLSSGTFTGVFSHEFDVTNVRSDSTAFRLWANGSASSSTNMESFSVKVGGVEIATFIPAFSAYGVGVYNTILLAAGETVKLVVSGNFTGIGASYQTTLATPIPAALFLFAPALLGFIGLRRRATALAA